MSVENITTEVLQKLKDDVYTEAKSIIPEILKALIPSIVTVTKIILDELKNDGTKIEDLVRQTVISPDIETQKFKKVNGHKFDEKLKARESEYYKYARCQNLLDLYTTCMEEEPVYVPRKFRNDDLHVMSSSELTVVKKLELSRLQAECEILAIRKDKFMENVVRVDTEIYDTINKANVSIEANEMLVNRWQTLVREDKDRIDLKWKKKNESTKVAFDKDLESE